MSEPFIGQIEIFAGNFAPRGYAFCNGQLLQVASNTALFSLLGTTYGGDGRTTFGVPNLLGRMPMGEGRGPGLTSRPLGQKSGVETVNLTVSQMPFHNHQLKNNAIEDTANQSDPGGNALSEGLMYATGTPNARTLPSETASQGGGQAHNNMPPILPLNFIIALQGLYPSRS